MYCCRICCFLYWLHQQRLCQYIRGIQYISQSVTCQAEVLTWRHHEWDVEIQRQFLLASVSVLRSHWLKQWKLTVLWQQSIAVVQTLWRQLNVLPLSCHWSAAVCGQCVVPCHLVCQCGCVLKVRLKWPHHLTVVITASVLCLPLTSTSQLQVSSNSFLSLDCNVLVHSSWLLQHCAEMRGQFFLGVLNWLVARGGMVPSLTLPPLRFSSLPFF